MKSKKEILDHLKPVKIETPDQSFFDQLAQKVVTENPKAKNERRLGAKLFKMSLAAAAVLLIGVVLFNDFENQQKPQQAQRVFLSEINDSEIYDYVDEHIEDFTWEEIEEVISDDDLGLYENLENTSELDFYFSHISDEEISTYINEEFIDLDEFEDELLIF